MKTYDVTFIGSGHAAWHAALTLKHAGKEVLSKKSVLREHAQTGAVMLKSYLKIHLKC